MPQNYTMFSYLKIEYRIKYMDYIAIQHNINTRNYHPNIQYIKIESRNTTYTMFRISPAISKS